MKLESLNNRGQYFRYEVVAAFNPLNYSAIVFDDQTF